MIDSVRNAFKFNHAVIPAEQSVVNGGRQEPAGAAAAHDAAAEGENSGDAVNSVTATDLIARFQGCPIRLFASGKGYFVVKEAKLSSEPLGAPQDGAAEAALSGHAGEADDGPPELLDMSQDGVAEVAPSDRAGEADDGPAGPLDLLRDETAEAVPSDHAGEADDGSAEQAEVGRCHSRTNGVFSTHTTGRRGRFIWRCGQRLRFRASSVPVESNAQSASSSCAGRPAAQPNASIHRQWP